MSISLIIPTYDGLSLLQKHLPSLLAAEEVADCELIIADDGSADGTSAWLDQNVPQARVVRRETNGGFSRICNAAIEAATGDFLLFLNNDVSVTAGFLPPLRRAMEHDSELFAVNSRILLPGKQMQDEGEKVGGFHNGIFYVDCAGTSSKRLAPTFYATACAALYRHDRVQALGGFDEIYSPFYWEDVDLSYRALRRGWKILYEPESVVYHEHETTTARFGSRYKNMIRERNQFLFVWKNMTDTGLMARSMVIGPIVALRKAIHGERGLWDGYRAAWQVWPKVRQSRTVERRAAVVADRALLARYAVRPGVEAAG